MTTETPDTKRLRMLAEKATPGPWKAHLEEAYFVTGPDLGRVAMMMNLKGAHGLGGRRSGDESAANCRLIAALDPATVLALCEAAERAERLEAVVQELIAVETLKVNAAQARQVAARTLEDVDYLASAQIDNDLHRRKSALLVAAREALNAR